MEMSEYVSLVPTYKALLLNVILTGGRMTPGPLFVLPSR